MNTALDTLVSEGVDAVKVSVLSDKLNCARSSFYWYFGSRADLLNALLEHWQSRNTQAIVSMANAPADTINMALVNVFSCWLRDGLFDTQLDFAIRDWARRDGSVRRAVDLSDDARITAIADMFRRFDYPASEALTRAKIVYFAQIGYEALDVRDSLLQRARTGRDYLYCHTGVRPNPQEVAAVVALTGHRVEDIA